MKYFLFALINAIIAGFFIFNAIYYNHFLSGIFALIFIYFVGWSWNKDTERIIKERKQK